MPIYKVFNKIAVNFLLESRIHRHPRLGSHGSKKKAATNFVGSVFSFQQKYRAIFAISLNIRVDSVLVRYSYFLEQLTQHRELILLLILFAYFRKKSFFDHFVELNR
jgi:hypothetical protein